MVQKQKPLWQKYFTIALVLVIAFLIRFIWIDRVPNSIGGDEMDYIVTARSIAVSGHDLTGTWSPLSLFWFRYPPLEAEKAELPYLLLAPFLINGTSIILAKLPFILLSTVTVGAIYAFAKKMISPTVAVVAALFAAINPWMIYIGRTAYEMTPAMCFYMTGLAVLVSAKGKKILWSVPFLFLAFYSYIGTKILLIPLVLIIVWYAYTQNAKRQYKKEYITVISVCLLLVGLFFVSLQFSSNGSRLTEIISPQAPEIAKEVDKIRAQTIQTQLTTIFENKLVQTIRIITTRFFKLISSDYLFLFGDGFVPLYRHGLFYYLDAVFLVIGALTLFAANRKTFLTLSALTLIATIPQIIHGVQTDNMTPHITMTFPFLLIIIAYGVVEIIRSVKNKFAKQLVIGVIAASYTILFIQFVHIYAFQLPLKGFSDFHVRVMSQYAVKAQEQQPIEVQTTRGYDQFRKYLFYTNAINHRTLPLIQKSIQNKKYTIENIEFKSCEKEIPLQKTIIRDNICGDNSEANHEKIIRLSDGGETYRIYNDKICNKRDPIKITLDIFDLKKLTMPEFCAIYIR